MKQLFTLISFLLSSFFISVGGYAQTTIEFTYDDSGNRTERMVISSKSATINSGEGSDSPFDELLEENIGLQKTLIYPNPTKGLLRIEIPALKDQQGTIAVYDSSGKPIIQQIAANSTQVDLSAYPSGYYIMIIRLGEERKEWKIIKE